MIENCVQVKNSKKSQFDATITLLQTLRGRREIKEVITSHACVTLQKLRNTDFLTIGRFGDCVMFQKLRKRRLDYWAIVSRFKN